MNFVLKDDATNNWWDNNSANFRVPLRKEVDTRVKPVDVLPKPLCDKWAWVRWDWEGRPPRSEQEATEEYERGVQICFVTGVQEMKELMARGRLLDELWRVGEGKWKYADYQDKVIKPTLGRDHPALAGRPRATPPQAPLPAAAATPAPPVALLDVPIPEDLIAVQAYVLWERAGKPQGADFAAPARAEATSAPQLSADKGSEKREMPLDFLVGQFALDPATQWRRVFGLGSKSQMLAVVRQEHKDGPVQVDMFSDAASPLVMHWGVTKPGSQDWNLPPEEVWPEATHTSGHAAETPFVSCTDFGRDVLPANMRVPLQRVTVTIPQGSWVGGLIMVLRSSDSTMWYKDAGGNFHLPVPSKAAPLARQEGGDPLSRLPDDLSRAIVEAEVKSSAWTLMHRFNKAADLVNEVLNGYYDLDVADAFSRVFVWLRYSATRKLTWQRNYNTQPRILSAAQDRLTGTVASAHARTSGEAQEWVRLLLTTEWHQKLHNNTTPDDVPICEAYLAYLESNGSMSAYWRTLSDAGITRQRLESYDRAITLEPQWFDGKKDALIRDFRNYLAILKAVHSGADLQASAAGAGNRIPGSARGFLAYVLSHLGDSQILPLMEAAVEARTELASCLAGSRELLYLDLALEDQVRQAAERGVGAAG
ncbi:R1 protein, alpha-glucan water dikinase, partial [Haematococcus lacustris]